MSSTFQQLKLTAAQSDALEYAKQKIQEDPNRLYNACKGGDLEHVKLLAVTPEIINSKGELGRTLLHWAAGYGCLEIVKLLLEREAGIDIQDNDGWTPLHIACQNGHAEVVQYLVEQGASVNAQDTQAWLPLGFATNNDSELGQQGAGTRVVILNDGSRVQELPITGLSPLSIACQKGHKEIAEILIQHGAKIDACTNYGYTPLHIACSNGHIEIVACLVEHGAAIDVQAVHENPTPLHVHCKVSGHKVEITKLLLFKSFFSPLKATINRYASLRDQCLMKVLNALHTLDKAIKNEVVQKIARVLVPCSKDFQAFAHHAPLALQQALLHHYKEDNKSDDTTKKHELLLETHHKRHFACLKNLLTNMVPLTAKSEFAEKLKKKKASLAPVFGHDPSDAELEVLIDQIYAKYLQEARSKPMVVHFTEQANNHETAALFNHIITTENFDALHQDIRQAIMDNITHRLMPQQLSSCSNRDD